MTRMVARLALLALAVAACGDQAPPRAAGDSVRSLTLKLLQPFGGH